VGVTESERVLIWTACCKHQLKPDVEICLKSKPDTNLGKTPHRVSLKRFVAHSGVSRKAAEIMIQDIASGRVKLFTERLAFSTASGWNLGAEWRGSGPGSQNNMAAKLGNIVLNGGTWVNIQHAMDRAPRVPLPHLATPPLAIFRWHARMASAPPPPMVASQQ
jgi:hypothetical protein